MFNKSFSQNSSHVPAWAKHAVWYQIFPERFRNGDTNNNPTVNSIAGGWPHENPKAWEIAPWTDDWFKQQSWETVDDKGFYYHVQQRRYGGDLQGVLDKLDYLSGLGINAIYFNPLFQSPSLHKYDATMYHHIDCNFGPDPEGDKRIWAAENPADPNTWQWTSADKLFLKVIQEAHRRNIRVVLDGVFNHVGMTFWAFEDLKKNQQQSQFKEWFTVKQWDDPKTPENEFDYAGWYGVKELPELRKDNEAVKNHIKAVVQRWMNPNDKPSDGVDGWRLDAADMVPMSFWKEFRAWVRRINPEAYIVGEVWWEDWKNDKMYNAAPWLQGDAFDAVMNYRWAREVCHFFVDKKNKISASEFDKRLTQLRSEYPDETNYVMMNLLDSHDTDRLPSRIANPDLLYDHNVGLHDNKEYQERKPTAQEIQIQKLMVLFQMTSLGAPMVYYGDEAGMWGGDDPDDRKPMLWDDLHYKDESHHPHGKQRPADKNAFNTELFQYYKNVISIRRAYDALQLGDCTALLTDDQHDVYAFLRSHETHHAIVIINNASSTQKISVAMPERLQPQKWESVFGEKKCKVRNGHLEITLSPTSGAVVVNNMP